MLSNKKIKEITNQIILVNELSDSDLENYCSFANQSYRDGAPIISDEDYERLLFEWSHPFYTRICKELGWEYPEMDEEGELADPQGFGAKVNASGKKLR